MGIKGQKVNPIGWRVGFNRKWKHNWYNINLNEGYIINIQFFIKKFLKSLFKYNNKKLFLISYHILNNGYHNLFIYCFFYRIQNLYNRRLRFYRRFKFLQYKKIYQSPISLYKFLFYNHKIITQKTIQFYENYFKIHLKKNQNIKLYNNSWNPEFKFFSFFKKNIMLLKMIIIFQFLNWGFAKEHSNNHTLIYLIKSKFEFFFNNSQFFFLYLWDYHRLNNWKNFFIYYYNFLTIKKSINKIKNVNQYYNLFKNSILFHKLYSIKSWKQFFYLLITQEYSRLNTNKLLKISLQKNQLSSYLYKKLKWINYNIVTSKILFDINSHKFKNLDLYYTDYIGKKTIPKFLKQLVNASLTVVYINSYAFYKYYYRMWDNSIAKKRRLSFKLKTRKALMRLDRDIKKKEKLTNRFGKYTGDLVKLGAICLYLKQPEILTRFIGFQIKQASFIKSRRQVPLIKFIMKTLLNLSGNRPEIIGLRIQVKGRFDRWRRTKSIVAMSGTIPYQTFNTYIEYGSSNAVIKKGTFGVRLWIHYSPLFLINYKKHMLQYLAYSSRIQYLKKLKFNHNNF